MPRQKRLVIPGLPHHITQRGNYGQVVFKEENDYRTYCKWISENFEKHKVKVIAFCLMNNHIHFILIPSQKDSIARVFNTSQMRFAQYMHKKSDQKGHLWEGRFFSCPLDEKHLFRAIRYVENNPVKAGIVENAWEYPWSSASEHIGERKSFILLEKTDLNIEEKNWKLYLQENDSKTANAIKIRTKKGLPYGDLNFITNLEKKI